MPKLWPHSSLDLTNTWPLHGQSLRLLFCKGEVGEARPTFSIFSPRTLCRTAENYFLLSLGTSLNCFWMSLHECPLLTCLLLHCALSLTSFRVSLSNSPENSAASLHYCCYFAWAAVSTAVVFWLADLAQMWKIINPSLIFSWLLPCGYTPHHRHISRAYRIAHSACLQAFLNLPWNEVPYILGGC